jgi:hypothetical protein
MRDQNKDRKHTLECMRLAAECRNIAGDVRTPGHLRAHFLSMAKMWVELVGPPAVEC